MLDNGQARNYRHRPRDDREDLAQQRGDPARGVPQKTDCAHRNNRGHKRMGECLQDFIHLVYSSFFRRSVLSCDNLTSSAKL
jgi:hypothetical protein